MGNAIQSATVNVTTSLLSGLRIGRRFRPPAQGDLETGNASTPPNDRVASARTASTMEQPKGKPSKKSDNKAKQPEPEPMDTTPAVTTQVMPPPESTPKKGTSVKGGKRRQTTADQESPAKVKSSGQSASAPSSPTTRAAGEQLQVQNSLAAFTIKTPTKPQPTVVPKQKDTRTDTDSTQYNIPVESSNNMSLNNLDQPSTSSKEQEANSFTDNSNLTPKLFDSDDDDDLTIDLTAAEESLDFSPPTGPLSLDSSLDLALPRRARHDSPPPPYELLAPPTPQVPPPTPQAAERQIEQTFPKATESASVDPPSYAEALTMPKKKASRPSSLDLGYASPLNRVSPSTEPYDFSRRNEPSTPYTSVNSVSQASGARPTRPQSSTPEVSYTSSNTRTATVSHFPTAVQFSTPPLRPFRATVPQEMTTLANSTQNQQPAQQAPHVPDVYNPSDSPYSYPRTTRADAQVPTNTQTTPSTGASATQYGSDNSLQAGRQNFDTVATQQTHWEYHPGHGQAIRPVQPQGQRNTSDNVQQQNATSNTSRSEREEDRQRLEHLLREHAASDPYVPHVQNGRTQQVFLTPNIQQRQRSANTNQNQINNAQQAVQPTAHVQASRAASQPVSQAQPVIPQNRQQDAPHQDMNQQDAVPQYAAANVQQDNVPQYVGQNPQPQDGVPVYAAQNPQPQGVIQQDPVPQYGAQNQQAQQQGQQPLPRINNPAMQDLPFYPQAQDHQPFQHADKDFISCADALHHLGNDSIDRVCVCVVVQLEAEQPLHPLVKRQRRKIAVADNTGCLVGYVKRATGVKFAEGDTIRMRNFAVKQQTLIIHSNTTTPRMTDMPIADYFRDEAKREYNRPKFPVTPIATVKKQALGFECSVKGTVVTTQQEKIVGKQNDKLVKEISVRDATGEMEASLWGPAAANSSIELNQQILLRDCKTYYSTRHLRPLLGVSNLDQITVSAPQDIDEQIRVEGIEETERFGTIILDCYMGRFNKEMTIDRTYLGHVFGLPHPITVRNLLNYTPFEARVHVTGQHITHLDVLQVRAVGINIPGHPYGLPQPAQGAAAQPLPQQAAAPQPPLQQAPFGQPPRQQAPIPEPPRQQAPFGQPPRQQAPIPQQPRQQAPVGQVPRQQGPIPQVPRQPNVNRQQDQFLPQVTGAAAMPPHQLPPVPVPQIIRTPGGSGAAAGQSYAQVPSAPRAPAAPVMPRRLFSLPSQRPESQPRTPQPSRQPSLPDTPELDSDDDL